MRTFKIILTGTIVLLVSLLAEARHETLWLDFDRRYVRNQRIYLKYEIKRRYPHIRLRRLQLDSVELSARSRRHWARAELFVNGHSQDWARIRRPWRGRRDDHRRRRRHWRRRYSEVELENYDRWSRGPWQIQIDGAILLKSIKVHVRFSRRGHRGDRGRGRRGLR